MRLTRGLLICLLLSVIGLGVSGYLFFLHLGLLRGELLGGPVCSGTGAFNCHAVTAGPWGSFLGMPLALWGALGYLTICALALLGRHSAEWARHTSTLIVGLASLFLLLDALLLYVMVGVIRVYCVFCLSTYVVNLLLLIVALWALGQPWLRSLGEVGHAMGALVPSALHRESGLFWGMMCFAVLGTVGVHASTVFMNRGTLGSVQQQIREFLAKQSHVTVEVAGDPTIGPANASIQMVEFSDFFCPACQRASQFNAILLANHRQDVSLTFKNFPLDTSCNTRLQRMVHPGACTVAAAAECAHLQGKFWSFHDMLFERGHEYNVNQLEVDAQRFGLDVKNFRECMASGAGMEAVKRDIAAGEKVGVNSTPTYVVNGMSIAGGLHPAMFDDLVAVLKENKKQ